MIKNTFMKKTKGHEALIVLILFILLNIIITPNFCSIGTINNIIIQMTPIMLTSLGMTWVIASGGQC